MTASRHVMTFYQSGERLSKLLNRRCSVTASRSGPTAVGAKHQVGCACRRPHAPLTSAHPRAHSSDARSPGRSRSSASFVLIALGHVHLLERFDAGADRRGPAASCCMYQRPSLRAGSLLLMHGGSAACLWSCVHACIVMYLTCHTFWWPCRYVI